MKFSAILFFVTQSLLAQQELIKEYWPNEIMNNRDSELVTILDQYDYLHYGAQVNKCFKIPKVSLNDVNVSGGNSLKVFSSDNCGDGYIMTIQGSYNVQEDSANWGSAILVGQYGHRRSYLKAEQELTKEYWPNEIMDDRENEVVSLLDYYDNLYYGAQINTCFKFPEVKIDSIVVGGGNVLKVFNSDDCLDDEVIEIKGTYSVDGNNGDWLSGKVVSPSGKRYLKAGSGHHNIRASSSRRHLKAADGHHRNHRGGKYQNYRIYRD